MGLTQVLQLVHMCSILIWGIVRAAFGCSAMCTVDWVCMRLNRKLDDELRHKAIDLAALYEHRLQARPLVLSTQHRLSQY